MSETTLNEVIRWMPIFTGEFPMPLMLIHPELLSDRWSIISVIALFALSLGIWVALHRIKIANSNEWLNRVFSIGMFVVRSAVGTASLWLAINLLTRLLVPETTWSLIGIAAFAAIGVEAIFAIYSLELGLVDHPLGRVLVGLRVALLLTVAMILLQPVFAWSIPRVDERFVAVLIDRSTSMRLIDQQLTSGEQLALVRALDPTIPAAPHDLNQASATALRVADELAAAADQYEAAAIANQDSLSSTNPAASTSDSTLAARAVVDLDALVRRSSEQTGALVTRLNDLLQSNLSFDASTRTRAEKLVGELDGEAMARLAAIESGASSSDGNGSNPVSINSAQTQQQIEHLRAAASQLRLSAAELPILLDEVDRLHFAALTPEVQAKIETLVQRTRAQIASDLLRGQDKTSGLLKTIRDSYSVRIFGFDADASEVPSDKLDALFETASRDGAVTNEENVSNEESAATDDPSSTTVASGNSAAQTSEADSEKLTDLAAALTHVRSQIPAEQLAGVLVVGDGRQTGPGDLLKSVGVFAAEQIPVSALVIGSRRPPVDARILEVTAPDTVLVDDSLVTSVRLSATGMRGRSIAVKLLEEGLTLTQRTIEIPEDEFVTSVELSHVPTEDGIRNYQVQLEPIGADETERDAFESNDVRQLKVAVSDERTEILLIEGRPRWEYGYLRSLFAGRDNSVQLQALLLEPEQIASGDARPPVPASATREAHQVEATALPADEAEWMKFDLIVLGDVSREHLTDSHLAILDRFVSVRGGALVVIAGSRHMPHRYQGTPLAAMLPFDVEPSQAVLFEGPEPSFRWSLTGIGERHAVTRQADTIEESRAAWDRVPEMQWRHPVFDVKPGSVVLAYAQTPDAEQQITSMVSTTSSDAVQSNDEERLRQARETFERQHALMAIRNHGAGRVLSLATDRTWRLRYRIGDTYHHRFWGQIVRWGTAAKLQSGGDFVQLGTDRLEYRVGEAVSVTARINDSFLAPIADPAAELRVYRGDEVVLVQRLTVDSSHPGDFSATIGELKEPGTYRIELISPEAERVFAGSDDAEVSTFVQVLAVEADSPEMLDVTADREGLERIALQTGGGLVDPGSSDLAGLFGEGTLRYAEPRTLRLWDSWPMLALMVVLLTAEWMLRKKGGLV